MKKLLTKILGLALVAALGLTFVGSNVVRAEEGEGEEETSIGTSISITPVSNVITLSAASTYDYSFKVTNGGDSDMRFEVYSAPYSYTYAEDEDEYKLGFSRENNYTQITRWISFKDNNGNYVEKPVYTAGPGATVEVFYRITTPESIPAGGQYAVIFAHTLSSSTSGSGIRTEASPGLIVYGRATGETIKTTEITNLQINNSLERNKGANTETVNHINAKAKVKNTGNVDFTAIGLMKVQGILGNSYYETPGEHSAISVIPDSELTVSDEWKETPWFGFFKVTWTVIAAGQTETIEKVVFIIPITLILIVIILLTALAFWIIMRIRRRKERRSKYMI